MSTIRDEDREAAHAVVCDCGDDDCRACCPEDSLYYRIAQAIADARERENAACLDLVEDFNNDGRYSEWEALNEVASRIYARRGAK